MNMQDLIFNQIKRDRYATSEAHLDELIESYIEDGYTADKALKLAVEVMADGAPEMDDDSGDY